MTRAVIPPFSANSNNPANPLRKASRPTLVRWIHILESLRSGEPPLGYTGLPADWKANAKQFAKALECSHRTILRDVETLRERTKKGVGAWQGCAEESVRLRIDGSKIGFMRERAWYPGHQFEEQADGSWILSFRASMAEHLAPFILQWAPHLEVLEPEHLRSKVKCLAGRAAALHADP